MLIKLTFFRNKPPMIPEPIFTSWRLAQQLPSDLTCLRNHVLAETIKKIEIETKISMEEHFNSDETIRFVKTHCQANGTIDQEHIDALVSTVVHQMSSNFMTYSFDIAINMIANEIPISPATSIPVRSFRRKLEDFIANDLTQYAQKFKNECRDAALLTYHKIYDEKKAAE